MNDTKHFISLIVFAIFIFKLAYDMSKGKEKRVMFDFAVLALSGAILMD